MIQSASARTRLLTCGASAIALMASMASPAFAQTAAQPGDAQCPIVDGVVTCAGNVAGGFRADRNATMQRLVFRDLTAPIAPTNGRPAIDVRPIGDLTLDLDASVTINSTNPGSSFAYTWNGASNPPDAAVVLLFDPARQTTATITNSGAVNATGTINYADQNSGAFFISDADIVNFTNSGTIAATYAATDTANRLMSGVRIVGADEIAFRNDGTIRNTGIQTTGVFLEGRSVQLINTGEITATYNDPQRRNGGLSNGPSTTSAIAIATPTAPAALEWRNTGTIRSVDTTRTTTNSPNAVRSYLNFYGRGAIDISNGGTLDGGGLYVAAAAQNRTDDLTVAITNSGPISGAELIFRTEGLSSQFQGRTSIWQQNAAAPASVSYRNVDVQVLNTGRLTTSRLDVSGRGDNVNVDVVNRGLFDGRAPNSLDFYTDPLSILSASGFAPLAGSATVRLANEGDMILTRDSLGTAHYLLVARSTHDVELTNSGNITLDAGAGRADALRLIQGENTSGARTYVFDGTAVMRNSGRLEINGTNRNAQETGKYGLFGATVSDLSVANSGAIIITQDAIRDPYSSFGALLQGYGDITFDNNAPITITSDAASDVSDGIGIALVEFSLNSAIATTAQAEGRTRGYDRTRDLASILTLNLNAGDVTVNAPGGIGVQGVLGVIRGDQQIAGLLYSDTIGNGSAQALINIAGGVSVIGGSGSGAGINVEGAGRVTLNNAGSIINRGDATSGGVVLGKLITSTSNYRVPTTPSDLTLNLVDSVNSGTIAGGSGRGIWVQSGSIENFVNSGTVRGGAGAISSSGRGQVTNLASGTIDGAVVLSGANSVLTNSGLVRLSGPGAVASTVNGDWMQSTGRLELGLDDTLSVAGNMTLAGELGLTLGAPSSTRIINVGGDLSVDARLDVTGDAGFGQGVYRLFDYGGTLSGNGLTVAAMPTGTSGTIQTAIAGQINLVVGGGVTPTPDIQFWDGTQTEANGAVNGGAGTWGGTATNWTDMNGAANAAWGSKFAVFQGTPATVTIAPEGVSASGLQFAVDGYRVEGGTLTLTAPATLRVGDASATGAGYTATIASAIAGSGGIDKTDLGTLVLTGVNTYTGGTRISGGTLAVSSDGALGAASDGLTFGGGGLRADGAFSSTRTITVNAGGSMIDTQAHSVTLSGALTGSGALAKAGAGTFTFSGDGSAYTGTLTNRAGTLAIDGSLGGSVISQGSVLTISGRVGGDARIGAGTATIGAPGRIGGDLFATGSAAVRLDGTVIGNADIASGARLSGIGSIGGALILAGTIAPGNSVGTLRVGGNATFAAGSVFDLELDADGSGDRLSVAGTTTIAGGTVRITTLDPELDYTDGSEYTFITSAGGLTGTFDSLSETSAFLDFVLGYDGNRAFVTVDVVRTFPDVAQTFNQRQASIGLAALDRTEGGDGLAAYNAILFLDEAPARAAFDAASGEIYPSLLQNLSLAAQARGRSLIVRSHATAGEGWGLWGGATGRDGHVAGDGNAARSSFDGYGFDLGMDYRGADNAWAAGARISWLKTNVQIDDRASSASGDGWALGGYARYGTGRAGFSASAAFDYADGSVDTARSMAFGTLSRTARAALDTNSIAASAELRYGLPAGGDWTVGPVASLDYGRGKIDGFAENGADALDLSSDGARSGATRYGGGAFASWQGEAGSFSLSAQYVTGKDRFADAVLTLDGAPTTPFTIRSPLRQADGALLDLTAGFDLGRGWRLGADASALLANGANDLRGRVSIGWQF